MNAKWEQRGLNVLHSIPAFQNQGPGAAPAEAAVFTIESCSE